MTAVLTVPQTALYTPPFEEVAALFEQGNLVPVYRAYPADLETPVSVYLKLAQANEPAFLLESVEGGEQVGRYSFLGVNPAAILSVRDHVITERRADQVAKTPLTDGEDPLSVIKVAIDRFTPVALPNLPRFSGGAVGFLSYDAVRHFERLPATTVDELRLPDAAFMLIDTLIVFDHVKHQVLILSNAHNEGDPAAAYQAAIDRIDAIARRLQTPLPADLSMPTPVLPADDELKSNLSREQFEENVRRAKEYIAAGDAFQIVVSQRLTRQTDADPFTIYRALRMLNPSPYMFYLSYPADDLTVIGASPEMMVRYDADTNTAVVRPIAGTRPRGKTSEEDQALGVELLADPKELAEHVMLVDLGRNDLGRVCDYGSVSVPNMMYVERYSHVMHIVSHIQGTLKRGMDAFSLLRATFPAGTLSGAPKIRAMEIIEELEGTRRGLYGGAVGYFSYSGSMDTCITIRTVLMRGKTLYLQVGAGIVADSDPPTEYDESINKGRAVTAAVRNAERGLI
ncbi:MAG: anthranilate synthase component I [Aggregatilineales bacterium]